MKTKYYQPKKHIQNLIKDDYYFNLIILRNTIQVYIDNYFQKLNAPKVDLYLISKGVSSPMGKGSDSLPVPITFGTKKTYLVDSAQFGMEPLVQKRFKMVYCYLPSFRGEEPDDRHLNQFYHCEAELQGDYLEAMEIAEGLVKVILNGVLKDAKSKKFIFNYSNLKSVNKILKKAFPRITFDEACSYLEKNNLAHLIENRDYGRVLSKQAEIEIGRIVGKNVFPVWIVKYDRDTVPFYQLVDPENKNVVLNADLIFPKIGNSFGGEVLGLGQRQNSSKGIIESMKRQEIKDISCYDWYIKMRKDPNYKTTSGFGLGIERLIAWLLGLNSIIDASIYPVLKGEDYI